LKKPEWTDEQLENSLKKFPKIQDDRDPHDIYQNVLLKLKNRPLNPWLVPSIVTASFFLLFLVLSVNEEKATENNHKSIEMALEEDSSSSNGINEKQDEVNIQMNVEEDRSMDKEIIEKTKSDAYFFFYPTGEQSNPLLIAFNQSYPSISEAFDAMQKDQTKAVKASIPEWMQIESVDDSNKILIIYLSDHSRLENNQSAVHTIEAILFTAKEFDFKAVRFENSPILEVGEFRLDHSIRVPNSAYQLSIDHYQ
jgi:hypothetical protein